MALIIDNIEPDGMYSFAGDELTGYELTQYLVENGIDVLPDDWSWHADNKILCDNRMRAIIVRMDDGDDIDE